MFSQVFSAIGFVSIRFEKSGYRTRSCHVESLEGLKKKLVLDFTSLMLSSALSSSLWPQRSDLQFAELAIIVI